jgi:hypothetical protein
MAGLHVPHSRPKCAKLPPNAVSIACGAHGAIGMRAQIRVGKATAGALANQYGMPCSAVPDAMEQMYKRVPPSVTSRHAPRRAGCIHGGHGEHAIDNAVAVYNNAPGKLYVAILPALVQLSTTTAIHTPALAANTP